MQIHAGLRKAIGLLVALAGCVALTAQLGCNGDSPTAPPPPPPGPDPVPVITGADLTFMVTNPPAETGLPGEILFDGRPIWSGPVVAPDLDSSYYYGGTVFSQVLRIEPPGLEPGVHTLTFRVPGKRATALSLSGWFHVVWFPGGAHQVASWQDQTAWVKSGQDWTLELDIPSSP